MVDDIDSSDVSDFVSKDEKDVWQTPPRVLDPIQQHDGIDLDPCAGEDTDIGETNIRASENGLAEEWSGTVFMNPPFSKKDDWLDKAVSEFARTEVDRVYALTPDSTTAGWWQEHIAEYASVTWFPKGRINYIDPETGKQKSGVSFGSAVSVFGTPPDSLCEEWDENGDLVVRPGNADDAPDDWQARINNFEFSN